MSKNHHWADQIAERIINQRPDQDTYTLASGITPSGTVHIGNFRELITVDFVNSALKAKGKNVRFIFSWDDYDVFRKIPKNMPKQEELQKYLGKPIIKTPDPFGEESSYAKHHEKKLENSLERVGIQPDFIYQADEYIKSTYAKGIETALIKTDEIKKILNEYRKEALDEKWLPISVFCGKCDSNRMSEIKYEGNGRVSYVCGDCQNAEEVNLSTSGVVKLLWRIDWPMRWAHEKVDFEPGGKDHSSDGGSFDTAKQIAKIIYEVEPPIYQMYDFVRIKGKGGKISSSSGEVITLDDVLEIYEPEIVRWIFSSYKTNVEFAISFDLDVLKIYEDYDRVERKYYGKEEVSEKQKEGLRRAYELAQIGEPAENMPNQPSLRHLCNIIQVNDFELEPTKLFYADELKNDVDEKKFVARFKCASNWIQNYAPEDFKFSINKTKINPEQAGIDKTHLSFIADIKNYLSENKEKIDEQKTNQYFYDCVKEKELNMTDAFKSFYLCLISKEKGPKLIPFMFTIGIDRVLQLIDF